MQALNTGNNHYTIMDDHPAPGDNYYRIKANNRGGLVQYSDIVKVSTMVFASDVNVYPNPVTGKMLNMQLQKLPAGKYIIAIVNASGSKQQLKTIELLKDVPFMGQLSLPSQLQPGIYRLSFTGPDNIIRAKTITVL